MISENDWRGKNGRDLFHKGIRGTYVYICHIKYKYTFERSRQRKTSAKEQLALAYLT